MGLNKRIELLKQLLRSNPDPHDADAAPEGRESHAEAEKGAKGLTDRSAPSQSYVPVRKEDWGTVIARPTKK